MQDKTEHNASHHNPETGHSRDGETQDTVHGTEEISLDSPCKEGCDHPEHQNALSEEESLRDKWLRAVADGENLRRRLEKEKKEGIDYALFRFAKELIAIADQLSWAVASVTTEEGQRDVLYQGVSMTLGELERLLAQFSILKVEALNQMFNPHVHQVMQEEEHSTLAPGTILQVLQNGYKMHDRLLRPAMVVVAKAKAE